MNYTLAITNPLHRAHAVAYYGARQMLRVRCGKRIRPTGHIRGVRPCACSVCQSCIRSLGARAAALLGPPCSECRKAANG